MEIKHDTSLSDLLKIQAENENAGIGDLAAVQKISQDFIKGNVLFKAAQMILERVPTDADLPQFAIRTMHKSPNLLLIRNENILGAIYPTMAARHGEAEVSVKLNSSIKAF